MGTSDPSFTLRLGNDIRNPISDAAKRFGLSESDMVRYLLHRALPCLRKKSIVLHEIAPQKRTA